MLCITAVNSFVLLYVIVWLLYAKYPFSFLWVFGLGTGKIHSWQQFWDILIKILYFKRLKKKFSGFYAERGNILQGKEIKLLSDFEKSDKSRQ